MPARAGSGAPKGNSNARKPGGFRDWCKQVADHPEVRASIEAYAKANPEFALKVAEHGYGRPSQAVTGADGGPILVRITDDSDVGRS